LCRLGERELGDDELDGELSRLSERELADTQLGQENSGLDGWGLSVELGREPGPGGRELADIWLAQEKSASELDGWELYDEVGREWSVLDRTELGDTRLGQEKSVPGGWGLSVELGRESEFGERELADTRLGQEKPGLGVKDRSGTHGIGE
jgi:hypothetical protein